MFEANMDEYLDEEIEYVKQCFEMVCRAWETNVRRPISCCAASLTLVPALTAGHSAVNDSGASPFSWLA